MLQVQSFEHDLEVRTSQGVLFFKPPLLAISVCAYGKKKKWLFVSKNEDEDEYDDND